MKIWGAFIVKDDSELEKFKVGIETVRPHLDGWLVVANGKETRQIEEYVRSSGGTYYYLPWSNDFAAQRNYAASKVPRGVDFYYWQDFDDILIGAKNLRQVAELALSSHRDIVLMDYWYGCTFDGKPGITTYKKTDVYQKRERLIKPGSHHWKGRLHETPMPSQHGKDNYTYAGEKEFKIAVMHTKTMDEAEVTMDRNKVILELQLADERKNGEADPRTLLYLMKIYTEMNEAKYWQDSLAMGEEYLKKSGWDEERATCYDLMAVCVNKLGDNNKAIEYLHDAIREYPHYPLLYMRLAMAYLWARKAREAKHWVEIGLKMPLDQRSSGNTHLQEMKILSAQVLLKLKYEFEHDHRGAMTAAEILAKEQPNEQNMSQWIFLQNVVDLEDACKKTDELFIYLESIGAQDRIRALIEDLPIAITAQPFAISWRRKVTPPRIWGDKEIAYFANFGQQHFEKWDGRSITKGIGDQKQPSLNSPRNGPQWDTKSPSMAIPMNHVRWTESPICRGITSARATSSRHLFNGDHPHWPHILNASDSWWTCTICTQTSSFLKAKRRWTSLWSKATITCDSLETSVTTNGLQLYQTGSHYDTETSQALLGIIL